MSDKDKTTENSTPPMTMDAEDSAKTQIIHLSVEDQRAFAEAILNPPPPSPGLRRAFEAYRKLIKTSR
jgi:uncharacterized protein (DUF1778 family)